MRKHAAISAGTLRGAHFQIFFLFFFIIKKKNTFVSNSKYVIITAQPDMKYLDQKIF